MVAPSEEKPLELWAFCSDTFCEEDSSAIPTSDLFHFTADIKGSCAAITIDDGSFINLVSIEVVEKLQLFTHPHFRPYLLATYDDMLPITQSAIVPITIYGHTRRIVCDVIPRALNCCHLLLGKKWCNEFEVDFDRYYPDVQFYWNYKKDWLSNATFNTF